MTIDALELSCVVDAVAGYPSTWAIAGGWALDLFVGEVSRPHGDIDVAVCRCDQRTLRRHLEAFELRKVTDGRLSEWADGEWLALPVHEIHVRKGALAFEVLLNECNGSQWVYRRDARIRRDLSHAIQHQRSVPFLAPEIVLLYKAKAPGAVDQSDFARIAPQLGLPQRQWLSEALRICHPGHPWLALLGEEA